MVEYPTAAVSSMLRLVSSTLSQGRPSGRCRTSFTGPAMSDESSRSARPSGQRRGDGAPAWWADLDRVDLPDDTPVPPTRVAWFESQPGDARLREIVGMEGM